MQPALITTVERMRNNVAEARRERRTVGVVPTMGALHEGHGSLMDRARRETGHVVVSIFVNPMQFDRRDDYEAYARDLPCDVAFCAVRGVDVVFAPSPTEMYPMPQATLVEVTGLQDHLCGAFRPGHFRGVATVVAKLFNIVAADKAYFGEKDAQQLAIVQRMVRDLNLPVEVVPVPTVREPDGLAMSSRNRRLSPGERRAAPALYRALETARAKILSGCNPGEAKRAAAEGLGAFRVEYLEVVDPATFAPVEHVTGPVRIAAAAWLGSTRLIDNVWCGEPVTSESGTS